MKNSTFALTDEQRQFRDTMRQFAEERIAPTAVEVDRDAVFPWKSFAACVEMELPALGIPEAYGGAVTIANQCAAGSMSRLPMRRQSAPTNATPRPGAPLDECPHRDAYLRSAARHCHPPITRPALCRDWNESEQFR